MTPAQLRCDLRRGQWLRPAPGVLVAVAAPPTWHQGMAVAVASTAGVVSHRAAARLHGFDGFREADPIEVTIERDRRLERPAWVVHQAPDLLPQDLTVIDGIRSTSIARTLVDLGAVVDDDLVEQALDDTLRRGVSDRWIRSTLERVARPGPSGCGALQRVLDRVDRAGPIPDLLLERLIERAARAAGLPAPERQVRVRDDSGRVMARIDAAWPDRLIGSEAQSAEWHGGRRGSQHDLDRHNLLTAMGWRMLYATWADVRDPTRYIAALRRLLAT